jgi:hypothetical protein
VATPIGACRGRASASDRIDASAEPADHATSLPAHPSTELAPGSMLVQQIVAVTVGALEERR